MKKHRIGVLVTVIADADELETVSEFVFSNTTTFGFRYRIVDRMTLDRSFEQIDVESYPVRIKRGSFNQVLYRQSLEFEDLKAISQRTGQPFLSVNDQIQAKLRQTKDNED